MKEYLKPELEFIELTVRETITEDDEYVPGGEMGTDSSIFG